MRIGFLSTRLAGLDGVSLETAKWAAMLRRMGHEVFYCAGELDPYGPPGMEDPLCHFRHPVVQRLQRRFFGSIPVDRPGEVRAELEELAKTLEARIEAFVERFRIEVLIIENASAIPMHLALGMAVSWYLARTGLPAIGHHHDFYWERERFSRPLFPDLLEAYFPPALPNLKHVVINRAAQRELWVRKQVTSVVIPNVMDFRQGPPRHNGVSLRYHLGLTQEDLFVLQPTRVVPRKGIEWSLELLHLLQQPRWQRVLGRRRPVLVVSHPAGDEGLQYLEQLRQRARRLQVPFLYIAPYVAERPDRRSGKIRFSLWDVYHQADGMTYPSRYEGFGNALLEGVYCKLPLLVNLYPIYREEIRPQGFRFVEMDHEITPEVVEAFVEHLLNPRVRREVVEHNYHVASQVYAFENVIPVLETLLSV